MNVAGRHFDLAAPLAAGGENIVLVDEAPDLVGKALRDGTIDHIRLPKSRGIIRIL